MLIMNALISFLCFYDLLILLLSAAMCTSSISQADVYAWSSVRSSGDSMWFTTFSGVKVTFQSCSGTCFRTDANWNPMDLFDVKVSLQSPKVITSSRRRTQSLLAGRYYSVLALTFPMNITVDFPAPVDAHTNYLAQPSNYQNLKTYQILGSNDGGPEPAPTPTPAPMPTPTPTPKLKLPLAIRLASRLRLRLHLTYPYAVRPMPYVLRCMP